MQAIETSYKRYRFRSKVEARWAVFFDSLRLNWSYEKQGFDLGTERYLPDFWIESFQSFVEIKPLKSAIGPIDSKAFEMSRQGKRVVILCGDPWPFEYIAVAAPRGTDSLKLQLTAQFTACEKCDNVTLSWVDPEEEENRIGRIFTDHYCPLLSNSETGRICCHKHYPFSWLKFLTRSLEVTDQYRINRAFIAARSARFEHGETPRLP